MSTANLLVELFVEELPPKALKKLGESFAQLLADGLKAQGLTTDHSAVTPFASPRRLAAHVSAVRFVAPDQAVSQKLMPVAVGLTADGLPTPALLKKLGALGVDASVVPQLKRLPDGKAEALFFDSVVAGVALAVGLQKALDDAIAKLPIPKLMSYQLETGEQPGWHSVHFVRPVHGLVALHGADVVPLAALGLQSGRNTRGHRFEASIDPVVLQHADRYAEQLIEQGSVIAIVATDAPLMAHQLKRLEGLGYLTREVGPEDSRIVIARLTPQGNEVARRSNALSREVVGALVSAIGEDDLPIVRAALKRADAALEAMFDARQSTASPRRKAARPER